MSSRLRNAWGYRPTLFAAAAITLFACGGDTEPTVSGPPARVSITPAALNLFVGAGGSLAARSTDARGRATSAFFEWSSADPAVATVGRNNGAVAAIAVGTTTVTASVGNLSATAIVVVRLSDFGPVAVVISPSALSLSAGSGERLTAYAYDLQGRSTAASFEWSSADPTVATVGRTDGIVTAVSIGATTVTAVAGDLRRTAIVIVDPDSVYAQWATGATASTEYTSGDWSALQATGAPNTDGCHDDPGAWANLTQDGVDWLELRYAHPVRPSEIRILENLGIGSIVKVEVKDVGGEYHTVFSAQPVSSPVCPRMLTIPVTGVAAMVSTVRVSVDQRVLFYWNEIDAVRLAGYR